MEQLTKEQIENWRKALVMMFGPYALIMSEEEIQEFRNKMQVEVSKSDEDNEK